MKYLIVAMLLLLQVMGLGAKPHLTVTPGTIIDLGDFEEKEVQTRTIHIRNTGDEPLVILKTFTGCPCTKVYYDKDPIEPGDSVEMKVVFDGRDRLPGSVKKVFRITSNAENSIVGVMVKGTVVRPFQK